MLEQAELVQAGVLGVEVLRGAAKVLGEASNGADVTLDGPGAVVAQLQVVDETLTQRRHGKAPEEAIRTPAADLGRENAHHDDKAQEQNQAAV